jgi:hypothetical protein
MVQHDEEHGRTPKEDGERVKLAVGNHAGGDGAFRGGCPLLELATELSARQLMERLCSKHTAVQGRRGFIGSEGGVVACVLRRDS